MPILTFRKKMKITNPLLGLSALLLTLARVAHADIYVIANSDGLAAADVRDIFLGEKRVAGAVRLVPIDNSALQAEFLSKVLKLNSARYKTLWTKKSFREGLNAPPVKAGDAEVLGVIKARRGGGLCRLSAGGGQSYPEVLSRSTRSAGSPASALCATVHRTKPHARLLQKPFGTALEYPLMRCKSF